MDMVVLLSDSRRLLLILWACSMLACAGPGTAHAESDEKPVVIVLSLDGVRHDYPDRDELPAFARIGREGVRAKALIPVFPSSTFPNHVSLATGVPVDVHGMVSNEFFDRQGRSFKYGNDASWIRSEPIWVTAERQGRRTATFFWVGSETDWEGTGATYRMTPFDSSIDEATKVDQIFAWLDLEPTKRPQLILSWWHGADGAGHRTGPDSDDTRLQLRGQDRELARLLAGLDKRAAWPHTTLLLVSDHGMTAINQTVDPGAALDAGGVTGARIWSAGSVASVFLDDPTQVEAAVTALNSVAGVRAFPRAEIPRALRFDDAERVGDVVALTDAPRVLGRAWSLKGVGVRLGYTRGAHGFDPTTHPEMNGIFFAMGRGVPPGLVTPPVSALDLAPTIAALLAIDPPPLAEGKPVPAIAAEMVEQAD